MLTFMSDSAMGSLHGSFPMTALLDVNMYT